ncbi:MAG TPA: sugar phosphate nucleotidyltransferase [Candidatus Saccharimonadia bacterium]
MIIVIIAGGSGTRLWPLSQANYPKHLLALTGKTSLLQNTVARARKITPTVYVITERSQVGEVHNQLPDVPGNYIIAEPGRRGTASCIVLALAVLAENHPPTEPVVFFHADSHIADQEEFAKAVEAAAGASAQHSRITLIGVRPTYAATGFGYIHRGAPVKSRQELYEVKSFMEKPNAATAHKYIKEGTYLWNIGLFAAPIETWKKAFKQYAPDLAEGYEALATSMDDPAALSERYLALKNQPIDTAVIEKAEGLLVVPGAFDWADIGSFQDLHKILQDKNHNVIQGDVSFKDSQNVMVYSTTGKPVIAIGLSDLVVVDTPDGLLVCDKSRSQLVGDAAKKLQSRKAAAK